MTRRSGSSRRLQLRWVTWVTIGSLAAVLAHPPAAAADQVADMRARAAQLAAQLNSQGRRADQLSEQYDGARLHEQQVDADLADAQAALASADAQAATLRARLAEFAVSAYVRGGSPLAVQLADPADVSLAIVGPTYEALAAGDEADLLDAERALRATLAERRSALETASRSAQQATAATGRLHDAAAGAAADEQLLLSKVNGDLATLVAQAQAALEARLAAQVQAALMARTTQQAASRSQAPVPAPTLPSPLVATPAPAVAPPTTSPPARPANGPPPPPPGPPAPAPPPSSRAAIAVATAEAQLGKPYQWGAAGPGSFDCSGLTMFAWAAAGVALPHFTGAQYAVTTHIPLSALEPGDLVFFYGDLSHVGLYVGGGIVIHAPHTGTVVSFSSIYQMGTTAIFASRVG